ncbi:MAG: signal peptidase II [Lachnospiraceae bacterium]|nr:signal peptidase II [Lachnospiraceae bacterium]
MLKLTKKKKILLLIDLLLTILLIAGDRLSKYYAVKGLKDRPAVPLIKGVLELNYLENHGAAFGMLQNQKIFLILIAALILIVICYVLLMIPEDKKYIFIHLLLSLLSAGAVGNMIDRLQNDYVVDFIYLVIIRFPIFNVADIYVTVAAFLLVILFLFYYKEKDFAFLSFGIKKKYREMK